MKLSAASLIRRLGPLEGAAKRIAFALIGSELRMSLRRKALRDADLVTILNLHRVAKHDQSAYLPLNPELFDRLLAYLRTRFSIVTFGQLPEPKPKPKLILSFDDGYRDFLEIAVPIMQRHGIRVNQNIVPACVESGLPPFNVLAQDFVGKAPLELVTRLDVPGFTATPSIPLGIQLSNFIKTKPQSEQKQLAEHLYPQFFNFMEFRPTPMMSREEVRQIAREHEIGAHSNDHASMEYETDDYLRSDLDRCAQYFAEHIGQRMEIYAFPNGSCRPAQIDIVRRAGVDHVLLVGERFSRLNGVHTRFTFYATCFAQGRFQGHGGLARINP